MRAYYLDRPLNDEELAFASEALNHSIEQVRIPHVLPAPNLDSGTDFSIYSDPGFWIRHLRSAGIDLDANTQVVLVAPSHFGMNVTLLQAIRNATGFYPYYIQTTDQRDAIGNPGSLRILDTEGLLGNKE
jgi:hypothetical protein